MTLEQNDVRPVALRVEDAAEYIGISASTLNKLRLIGGGPPYVKIGRAVVYLVADLNAWLESKRRRATIDDV